MKNLNDVPIVANISWHGLLLGRLNLLIFNNKTFHTKNGDRDLSSMNFHQAEFWKQDICHRIVVTELFWTILFVPTPNKRRDPVDVNPPRRVVDSIKNAIISDPDTIAVIPRQLETSGRTSGLGEGSQLFAHRCLAVLTYWSLIIKLFRFQYLSS